MDGRHASAPLALCGIFALTLGLSACGNSSLSSGEATASAPVPSETKAAALAAMVPAKIKSAGKIVVGVDASYAPNEFLASDGTTVKGMDVDLFNAVGQTLGLKVDWQPAKFDSIITGVQGGKYDVGVSSFTINPQRKQQVNMVSYFNAGTQWATAPGNPKKVNTDSPCGINVAVQKGTVQQEQDLPVKVGQVQGRRQADQHAGLHRPGPGDRRGGDRQGGRDARRLARGRLRGQAVRRQGRGGSAASTTRPRTASWSPSPTPRSPRPSPAR